MSDPPAVIRRIRLEALPAYAATFCGPAPAPGAAPITRIRALSQARNPCARPDDIGLLAAYRDDRVIGYHGVLPGLLALDGRISRVHWSSAVYVAEDFRGRGVGRRLIEAFKSLGKDLAVPGGMTASAEGAYLAGGFRPLGRRAYFQLRVERAWREDGLQRVIQALGALARGRGAALWNRVNRQALDLVKRRFYRRAAAAIEPPGPPPLWRQVERIGPCPIGAPERGAVFLRTDDTVNWMLANPWVYSRRDLAPGDLAGEVRHYYFTKTRELFRYAAFELFSPGRTACSGHVVLSLSRSRRRAQVKILDHAAGDPQAARAACRLALAAARRILADRIELPTGLAPHFRASPLLRPLLKRQALLCVGFPAGETSPLAAAAGRIDLGICDGDGAFT